jgi:hypothetical protein
VAVENNSMNPKQNDQKHDDKSEKNASFTLISVARRPLSWFFFSLKRLFSKHKYNKNCYKFMAKCSEENI